MWWLTRAPIVTVGHRVILDRAWDLCDSITGYDAHYVALAGSNGHKVAIEVYPVS